MLEKKKGTKSTIKPFNFNFTKKNLNQSKHGKKLIRIRAEVNEVEDRQQRKINTTKAVYFKTSIKSIRGKKNQY